MKRLQAAIGVFLIQIKQKRHPFGFGLEILLSVGGVNGFVEFLMGFQQYGRHGERVIKVGKRRIRKLRPGIQYGLGFCFNCLFVVLTGVFRPGEVVVNKIN
jgi:hypothetical protein